MTNHGHTALNLWLLLGFIGQCCGQSLNEYDLPGNLVNQGAATIGLPTIIRQPVSQVVSSGDRASFSVVVADTSSVSYQWRFNGANLISATQDALLLTNVTAASEGNYSVVVGNSSGSITSAPAMLYFDSVGDGLPDFWKIQYFGGITNTTAASDAPLHDGISNLQKFLEGTNPTNGVGLKPRLLLGGLNGSVSASPDLDKYTQGQQVTLTATPHPGFQFVGWSGDLLGTNNPAVLSLDTNKNVTAVFSLPLSFALDATNISWRSGGDVPWFGQDFITYDGVAAAQNGPLGNNQVSWLQATVYLPADGALTFWWKRVPSAGSSLTIIVNGVPQFSQTPNLDWSQATYYLPAGTDVIRWSYAKRFDGGQGFDAYWIDQVAATVFPDQLADTDFDGLPDLWEYQHFGGLINDGTSDYDKDGVNNRQEYLDCTDPMDFTSVFPRLTVSGSGGSVAPSPPLSSYAYLQPVTLTAIPKSGYNFVAWGGDLIASTNPATLIMDKSKAVSATFALSAPNAVAQALDATNLIWSVGGDASFFAQTSLSHDGVDAVQSPPLASNQQAWFQTTVNGPGPLSFWWKSSTSFGQMQFLVNGVQKRTLSGSADWVQFNTPLATGPNTLRWVFVSNFPPTQNGDVGWVDQVVFGTNVPAIVSAPVSKTVLQGSNVTFAVTAGSSAPLSYRWQKNGVNLSDGISVSGATTNTLTLGNVQPTDSGNYSVLVSTPATSVSSAASLTVVGLTPLADAVDANSLTWNSGGNSPWFGQNLVSHDGIGAGQSGGILNQQESWAETTVNGPGALNFWWKVSCTSHLNFFDFIADGLTNATITGEVDWMPHSFLLSPGTHVVRWRYRQSSTSLSSQGAWLDQVSLIPGVPPAITVFPISQVVTGGVNVDFTVAASGTAPMNYQWFFNRTNPIGSDASILTLSKVQFTNAGGYSVVISNALGKTTSPSADLVVEVSPFITSQPVGAALLVGTNITLSVVADGADPIYYFWQKDGYSLAGSTQPSLSLNNLQPSDSGSYAVIVSNWLGSVTSEVAQVVVGLPPTITIQPIDQTTTTGSTATFSVVATGTAPIYYQWRQDSVVLPGETSANLVLSNVQSSSVGLYDVMVSNALGSVFSTGAFLSLGSPTPPGISVQPTNTSALPGGLASFNVQAFGIPTPSYQWLHDGTNLAGNTFSTLLLTNVQVPDAGLYSVFLFNSVGSLTSQVAALTVGNPAMIASLIVSNGTINLSWNTLVGRDYQAQLNDDISAGSWSNFSPVITATNLSASTLDSSGTNQRRYYRVALLPQELNTGPAITVQPASQTVSAGSTVMFSVTATGTPPLSYQWRFNQTNLPGQNSPTLQLNNVQSTDIGIYDVVVSNSFGSQTSDSAFLIVF